MGRNKRASKAHEVIDDGAQNSHPVVDENSMQPLMQPASSAHATGSTQPQVVDGDLDDVMHNLELTHEFKKARQNVDKQRKAMPLSKRLATIKDGKTLGAAAMSRSLTTDLGLRASMAKTAIATRAMTSDLMPTDPPPDKIRSQASSSSTEHRLAGVFAQPAVRHSIDTAHAAHAAHHAIEHKSIEHNLQLDAFQRAVKEEMQPVSTDDLPVIRGSVIGQSVPICECYEKCALFFCKEGEGGSGDDFDCQPLPDGHVFDPNEEGVTYLWVCSLGQCMHYVVANIGSNRASQLSSPETEDFEISQGHIVDTASSEYQPPDKIEQTYSEELLAKTPSQFWADVTCTRLDPEMANLSIHRSYCHCGLASTMAICNVSGDLYWVCPTEKCTHVQLIETRPDNVDSWAGYVGVITPMGDCDLDRYTNLAYLQKNLAKCFTFDFMTKLTKSGVDAPFPKGSFPLTTGKKQYDAFLSYRGATGRLALYLTLIGEFNFIYAGAFVYLIGPFIVAGMSFIKDPCVRGWPLWLMGSDGCMHDAETGERFQGYSWLIWKTWATPIVLFIIWCGPLIWSWRSYYRIFLDKFCIHQGCKAKNGQGLLRLPLYLQNSRSLYCLFDVRE